eukprot:TRINITY_DN1927_c0_g1_i9.p1 TRINITY_DN1927_c0_g1~~TRINITY_DN1927_c0_g1_i9.p1  ORF type:complete len:479 (-),score=89.91 TRINITY_DN1927_c0_g1_i9:476-1912(-)
MGKTLLLLLLLALLTARASAFERFTYAGRTSAAVGRAGAAARATPRSTASFTVLHTNDFHGWLDGSGSNGGSARIQWKALQIASQVNDVLLVDAGDVMLAGPPVSQLLTGNSTVDIYNMMGYTAAAFGNHEFDKGIDLLKTRIAQASFSWLGANIVTSANTWTQPSWARAFIVVQRGGAKICLLGLTTQETPALVTPNILDGVVFRDFAETVEHYYTDMQAQCDFTVVLAHSGTTDITENGVTYGGIYTMVDALFEKHMYVELVLGGHTDEVINPPVVRHDTVVVIAGYHGFYLGEVGITLDTNAGNYTLDIPASHLNAINNVTCNEDPQVAARVAYWDAQVAPYTTQYICKSYVNLECPTTNTECNLGDLIADAYLWQANQQEDEHAQLGFLNMGGIRASILCSSRASAFFHLQMKFVNSHSSMHRHVGRHVCCVTIRQQPCDDGPHWRAGAISRCHQWPTHDLISFTVVWLASSVL